MENISKPKYGIVDSGLFGARIVAGIVTGVRYTEDLPIYEISFGSTKVNTSKIADSPEEIFKMLNLASLERIKETHGLKIKFKQ